jgi:hypothetical protein
MNACAHQTSVSDFRLRVEMLKGARFDSSARDESIHLGCLQTDNAPELIGRDLALIDELVQRSQRHTKTGGGLVGAEPGDFSRHGKHCSAMIGFVSALLGFLGVSDSFDGKSRVINEFHVLLSPRNGGAA